MAASAMPPLNWTCPICGQTVLGEQTTCPNCTGAGASQPQAQPAQSQPRSPARRQSQSAQPPAGPACPHCGAVQPQLGLGFCTACGRPLAAQPQPAPPRRHGGNLQYQQSLTGTHVDRNDHVVNYNWYKFLLWMLVLGGLAFLAWLVFSGYQWGWHANPCKPPCTSAPSSTATANGASAAATKKSASMPSAQRAKRTAAHRPTQSAAPQRVQLSGSVDLVHHEAQTQTATPSAPPARPSTPEELDEATARWLEGQRNP